MRRQGVDFSIYGRALLLLAKHPTIIALPLLAAVTDMLVTYVGSVATDPLGGLGNSLFAMIVQIIYFFAFGIAIIQANNVARGYHTKFDDAWEEGKHKMGAILITAIGFQLIVSLGGYVAQLLPIGPLAIVLKILAYYFLIFSSPAAAIGGLPGSIAIQRSIEVVRANPVPSIVLTIAFAVLWVGVPRLVAIYASSFSVFGFYLTLAIARAVSLALLAFPFATTYDDINFKRW